MKELGQSGSCVVIWSTWHRQDGDQAIEGRLCSRDNCGQGSWQGGRGVAEQTRSQMQGSCPVPPGLTPPHTHTPLPMSLPWTGQKTALHLGFLICELGMVSVRALASQDRGGHQCITHERWLAQHIVPPKPSNTVSNRCYLGSDHRCCLRAPPPTSVSETQQSPLNLLSFL